MVDHLNLRKVVRTPPSRRAGACLVLSALAVVTWWLQLGLPAETFFVGDSGVKLVVARHAIAEPSRPLSLPLPAIGTTSEAFVDPFFVVHGDHMHAITTELFPLLSAPALALWGTRGLYVLPALSFVIAVGAWAFVAIALDSRRQLWATIAGSCLATPWLFYGLEFWEHAPAVAVAAAGVAVYVAACSRIPQSRGLAATAGALFAVACLFRPEAICFTAAVFLGTWLLTTEARLSRIAFAVAGFVLIVALPAFWHWMHFRTLAGPHVTAASSQLVTRWLTARAEILRVWFVDRALPNFVNAAPVVLLALVPVWGTSRMRGRGFLAATAGLTLLMDWLTAPNDGGGQWGPRFALLVYGPLSVLVADTLQRLKESVASGKVLLVAMLALGSGRRGIPTLS